MKRAASIVILLALLATADAADRAALESVKTEWQNLYGVIVYAATANVKNLSAAPLRFVKVKLVLRDKDGNVVAEKLGYNLAAEALGDDAGADAREKALARVKPIPAAGSDPLRLSLEKEEIGRPFRTAELSIVEAE